MHTKKLLLAAALVGGAALLASLRSPEPAAAPAPALEASSAATVYTVDGGHSSLVFRVMHMNTAWVFGRFNELGGTFTYDPAKPANSSVEIEVKAESVDTASRGRDEHLRGSDFFDAKQFPTITFKSTGAKAVGKDRIELTGELTLRGHTETITFQIEKTGEGQNRQGKPMIGFLGEFKVDRLAHGVSYMPGGLGQEVVVTVSLEAVANDAAK